MKNTESVETEDKRCVITFLPPEQKINILRCNLSDIDRLIAKHTDRREYEMVSVLNKRKEILQQIHRKINEEKTVVFN